MLERYGVRLSSNGAQLTYLIEIYFLRIRFSFLPVSYDGNYGRILQMQFAHSSSSESRLRTVLHSIAFTTKTIYILRYLWAKGKLETNIYHIFIRVAINFISTFFRCSFQL